MKKTVLLLSIILLAACKNDNGDPNNEPTVKMLQPGTNFFRFDTYKPLADKPVNIYYHIPEGIDLKTAPVVMVFHGMSRNADDYRDYWISSAGKYGFMIFCPEFSEELYPSYSDSNSHYNLGNMITDYTLNPKEVWTYSIINPIFDRIKLATGNVSESFYMFGHSAGAQFVHRSLTFLPEIKAKQAVAANAGWYTMPDTAAIYPYGLADSYVDNANIPLLLERELVVLLGTADTLRTSSLRQNEFTDAQGLTRFARGHYFYNWSSSYTDKNGLEFSWSIIEVPGIGHSGSAMSVAAADFLFGDER